MTWHKQLAVDVIVFVS